MINTMGRSLSLAQTCAPTPQLSIVSIGYLPFLQTQSEPLRKLKVVTSEHPLHGRAENLMQTICVFCYRKMQS